MSDYRYHMHRVETPWMIHAATCRWQLSFASPTAISIRPINVETKKHCHFPCLQPRTQTMRPKQLPPLEARNKNQQWRRLVGIYPIDTLARVITIIWKHLMSRIVPAQHRIRNGVSVDTSTLTLVPAFSIDLRQRISTINYFFHIGQLRSMDHLDLHQVRREQDNIGVIPATMSAFSSPTFYLKGVVASKDRFWLVRGACLG